MVTQIFVAEDIEPFLSTLSAGQRLMGIDAGTRTLGLALSDVERSIASPLETIERRKFTPDAAKMLARATELCVGGFVLGMPINLDGSEGPRAQATRAFARNLARLDPRPILYWDERWTTVAAERALLEADTSRRKRADVIDKVAAAIILQGVLDRAANIRRALLDAHDQR